MVILMNSSLFLKRSFIKITIYPFQEPSLAFLSSTAQGRGPKSGQQKQNLQKQELIKKTQILKKKKLALTSNSKSSSVSSLLSNVGSSNGDKLSPLRDALFSTDKSILGSEFQSTLQPSEESLSQRAIIKMAIRQYLLLQDHERVKNEKLFIKNKYAALRSLYSVNKTLYWKCMNIDYSFPPFNRRVATWTSPSKAPFEEIGEVVQLIENNSLTPNSSKESSMPFIEEKISCLSKEEGKVETTQLSSSEEEDSAKKEEFVKLTSVN